ncbi:hypothetical protein HZA45_03450 [Candidatus Peregrinibacteria bacterium]|nr:hypothetical protein [Candidatus Peregrinibacteria bacterium]
MPTKKKRLNITLQKDVALFLKKMSLRDDVPQATKAAELLEMAMEIEEDDYFTVLAEKRLKANKGFISHEEFWK